TIQPRKTAQNARHCSRVTCRYHGGSDAASRGSAGRPTSRGVLTSRDFTVLPSRAQTRRCLVAALLKYRPDKIGQVLPSWSIYETRDGHGSGRVGPAHFARRRVSTTGADAEVQRNWHRSPRLGSVRHRAGAGRRVTSRTGRAGSVGAFANRRTVAAVLTRCDGLCRRGSERLGSP